MLSFPILHFWLPSIAIYETSELSMILPAFHTRQAFGLHILFTLLPCFKSMGHLINNGVWTLVFYSDTLGLRFTGALQL